MKLIHKPDGWYVTEIPECHDLGPYTRGEASDHKRLLQATFDNWDNREFFTCDNRAASLPSGKGRTQADSPLGNG